jgi:hypothetical protein
VANKPGKAADAEADVTDVAIMPAKANETDAKADEADAKADEADGTVEADASNTANEAEADGAIAKSAKEAHVIDEIVAANKAIWCCHRFLYSLTKYSAIFAEVKGYFWNNWTQQSTDGKGLELLALPQNPMSR